MRGCDGRLIVILSVYILSYRYVAPLYTTTYTGVWNWQSYFWTIGTDNCLQYKEASYKPWPRQLARALRMKCPGCIISSRHSGMRLESDGLSVRCVTHTPGLDISAGLEIPLPGIGSATCNSCHAVSIDHVSRPVYFPFCRAGSGIGSAPGYTSGYV